MEPEEKGIGGQAIGASSSELGDIVAFFGHEVGLKGVLTYKGSVKIEGQFDGEIETDDTLFIGEQARVTAQIRAGSVVASGSITGNITARQRVELKSPAVIDASLFTPRLSIDNGVVFNGKIAMTVPGMPTPKVKEVAPVADTTAISEVFEGQSNEEIPIENGQEEKEKMQNDPVKPFKKKKWRS